jgi:hypothetical protein
MRTNLMSRLGQASAAIAVGTLAIVAMAGSAQADPWHHHGWRNYYNPYAPRLALRSWAPPPAYYAPPAYAYTQPGYYPPSSYGTYGYNGTYGLQAYNPEPVVPYYAPRYYQAPGLTFTIPLR